MRVLDTPLPGVRLLHLDSRGDERGAFTRLYCADALADAGVDAPVVQANHSSSAHAGTLRGMHYHLERHGEWKLVRVLHGRLHDVVLDVRPGSPAFGRSFAAELSADAPRALLVPPGVAHGFLTLADATEVLYLVTAPYAPALERGVRHDDPAFGLLWPATPAVVSGRDRTFPDWDPGWHLGLTA